MSGVNVRNLEKIQDKWLLFQRFVTSIVGCFVKGFNFGWCELVSSCQESSCEGAVHDVPARWAVGMAKVAIIIAIG